MQNKYFRSIVSLMAAYPGKEFAMGEIVRYVRAVRGADRDETIRIGVRRAVDHMADIGLIEKIVADDHRPGQGFKYAWR